MLPHPIFEKHLTFRSVIRLALNLQVTGYKAHAVSENHPVPPRKCEKHQAYAQHPQTISSPTESFEKKPHSLAANIPSIMQIIVVGAGIGGLSIALSLSLAGHKVTILESASALAEIGAGVQLTPNSTKYFWKWGLGPAILEHSVLPGSFNVRRGKDGELLGRVPFDGFEGRYGGPYIVIHRADIHRILHEHAIKAGAQLRLNSRVMQYDFEGGGVTLSDGEEVYADLVVAADGINSFARKSFVGDEEGETEKTGWAAYRTMAPVDKIRANPQTAHLVQEHSCNCWNGDSTSFMTYMIKNSQMLNIVLSHPDDVDTSEWTTEQYQNEITRLFGDWNPLCSSLLSIASPEVQNWPVYQVKSLSKWASDSGKFVLMGDAAHAMAFYLSMGVSMAVEDAEALAECLSLRETSNCSLKRAVNVFEKVRKPRAEGVREASLHAGNMLHLPPGPRQEIRDQALRTQGVSSGVVTEAGDFYKTKTSYGIVDQGIRDWCYGYDVKKDVQETWDLVKQ